MQPEVTIEVHAESSTPPDESTLALLSTTLAAVSIADVLKTSQRQLLHLLF